METEGFLKSLSESDWDVAEAIEAELAAVLATGLTEKVAIRFVQTVMEIRKTIIPEATVVGVFDTALNTGLLVLPQLLKTKAKPSGKRAEKTAVRGVARG